MCACERIASAARTCPAPAETLNSNSLFVGMAAIRENDGSDCNRIERKGSMQRFLIVIRF
jgi:hypothetical protein